MCDIPVEVDQAENVVRAIFSNHVDKQKLRREAFKERNDDLSVMRHSHIGSDQCKQHALRVRPGNPQIKYKGLAIIGVKEVRGVGSEVTDTRDGNYCGHARLSHGLPVPPPEDPLSAEKTLALHERLDAIKKHARYYPDPDPAAERWTGGELK
jgi:hypothetical protein